jgi:membrane-anchored protein YejM (alkaline phosphatase superfamily)
MLGALVWWFSITYFVNKLRKRFNLRGIWILNRIIGSVVVVVAAVGLIFTLLGESLY